MTQASLNDADVLEQRLARIINCNDIFLPSFLVKCRRTRMEIDQICRVPTGARKPPQDRAALAKNGFAAEQRGKHPSNCVLILAASTMLLQSIEKRERQHGLSKIFPNVPQQTMAFALVPLFTLQARQSSRCRFVKKTFPRD